VSDRVTFYKFSPSTNSPHCTETQVPSPCSQEAVTGPTLILKSPLQCTNPTYFLFSTNAKVSIQFRQATPRLLIQQLRSEPCLNLSYVANVTIFTKHFRSNKMQSPLLTKCRTYYQPRFITLSGAFTPYSGRVCHFCHFTLVKFYDSYRRPREEIPRTAGIPAVC
jgi:hypothetical protein